MEKKIKEQFEEEIKFWQNKIDNKAKNKGVSIDVLETIYKSSIIGFFGGWALGFFGGIICPFLSYCWTSYIFDWLGNKFYKWNSWFYYPIFI